MSVPTTVDDGPAVEFTLGISGSHSWYHTGQVTGLVACLTGTCQFFQSISIGVGCSNSWREFSFKLNLVFGQEVRYHRSDVLRLLSFVDREVLGESAIKDSGFWGMVNTMVNECCAIHACYSDVSLKCKTLAFTFNGEPVPIKQLLSQGAKEILAER